MSGASAGMAAVVGPSSMEHSYSYRLAGLVQASACHIFAKVPLASRMAKSKFKGQ